MGDNEREEARAIVKEIRATESCAKVWSLAQKHHELLRTDWEYVKVKFMYRAVATKYAQYPDYAKELAATSGPIETSLSTANWQRMNRLILERVREELRPIEQCKKKYLAALVSLTEPYEYGDAVLQKLRDSRVAQPLRRDHGLVSLTERSANAERLLG